MQDLQLVIHGAARKCGQASYIQASYIQAYYNKLGFDMELDDSDKICGSCYNHHLKVRATLREISHNEELEKSYRIIISRTKMIQRPMKLLETIDY